MDLSVVVCTFNRAASLSKALPYWTRIETTRSWELIVVDNNSNDSTKAILAEAAIRMPRLRIVQERRRGLGAARNRGWRSAAAPIIAFTDDDCYPAVDYVEMMLAVFEEDAQLSFMGGRITLFDPLDAPITIDLRTEPQPIVQRTFLPGGTIHGANMAFRRSALDRINGFDERLGAGTFFRAAEDIDAVAALAWSGFQGKFDPRPSVSHNHGRKNGHARAIMRSYERGSAAYHAKFIAEPKTRGVYFNAWRADAFGQRSWSHCLRIGRQLFYGIIFGLRVWAGGTGRPPLG